ncbi:hypothetical protein BY458DRAFT_545783 [Sporodiniella umbellata]|nr:hypothetical protein BY458DRAFT_545783 [Sporodiniella umbellata]
MSQYQFTSAQSSVIPIIAPSSEETAQDKPAKVNSAKRLCRNIIIHGYCKFENKGCEFNHDTSKSIVLPQTYENRHTPLADNINAPVFVPGGQDKISTIRDPTLRYSAPPSSNNNTQSSSIQSFNLNPHVPDFTQGYNSPMMSSGNMDPYFYTPSYSATQYHCGPPTLPHIANLLPHQRLAQSFLIPDNLNEQLLKRHDVSIQTKSSKSIGFSKETDISIDTGLPEEVHVYHSLCSLEEKPGQFFGHPCWIYKAISRNTGNCCIMVRVEGFRLVNEHTMTMVNKWKKLKHANIVSIKESFTTRAFGDSSLVFIYEYHPNSITLYEAYFTPQAQALLHARLQAAGGNILPVPETTLWSFMTQIASALKAIHAAGLSARTIDPKKILMTSKNRLRLSGCGILDVLQYETTQQKTAFYQQEDLLNFGKLVISLACNSLQSFMSLPQSLDYISQFYSSDLKNTIFYLLSKPCSSKSIDKVIHMLSSRLLHEIDSTQYYEDALESNLSMELENGRLVRLLSKLGFINERPEFNEDQRWSDTGDRYMIKLFREYIFHQVNELGIPVTDMGHVVSCLNKLDSGVDEKILLTSRDDQTSIIVSYKELKASISSSFNDICSTQPEKKTSTIYIKLFILNF